MLYSTINLVYFEHTIADNRSIPQKNILFGNSTNISKNWKPISFIKNCDSEKLLTDVKEYCTDTNVCKYMFLKNVKTYEDDSITWEDIGDNSKNKKIMEEKISNLQKNFINFINCSTIVDYNKMNPTITSCIKSFNKTIDYTYNKKECKRLYELLN